MKTAALNFIPKPPLLSDQNAIGSERFCLLCCLSYCFYDVPKFLLCVAVSVAAAYVLCHLFKALQHLWIYY